MEWSPGQLDDVLFALARILTAFCRARPAACSPFHLGIGPAWSPLLLSPSLTVDGGRVELLRRGERGLGGAAGAGGSVPLAAVLLRRRPALPRPPAQRRLPAPPTRRPPQRSRHCLPESRTSAFAFCSEALEERGGELALVGLADVVVKREEDFVVRHSLVGVIVFLSLLPIVRWVIKLRSAPASISLPLPPPHVHRQHVLGFRMDYLTERRNYENAVHHMHRCQSPQPALRHHTSASKTIFRVSSR